MIQWCGSERFIAIFPVSNVIIPKPKNKTSLEIINFCLRLSKARSDQVTKNKHYLLALCRILKLKLVGHLSFSRGNKKYD